MSAYGEHPWRSWRTGMFARSLEDRADKPTAAKKRLRAMQGMFKWALANQHVTRNPTGDVAPIPFPTSKGPPFLDAVGRTLLGSVRSVCVAVACSSLKNEHRNRVV